MASALAPKLLVLHHQPDLNFTPSFCGVRPRRIYPTESTNLQSLDLVAHNAPADGSLGRYRDFILLVSRQIIVSMIHAETQAELSSRRARTSAREA